MKRLCVFQHIKYKVPTLWQRGGYAVGAIKLRARGVKIAALGIITKCRAKKSGGASRDELRISFSSLNQIA